MQRRQGGNSHAQGADTLMAWLRLLSALRILTLRGSGEIDTRHGVFRINDALSQFLNAAFWRGDPNECISGRCWREQRLRAIRWIDRIFFWQDNHCKEAWEKDNYWAMQRAASLRRLNDARNP